MDSAISQTHAECLAAFMGLAQALSTSSHHETSLEEVRDVLDRYKLWAGNVGAMHSGTKYRMSLDYRLREATFYKEQVLSLMRHLQSSLEKALQSVERETSGIYEDPEDDSRASSISTDEAGPESPWEVSSDSDVEQTVAPKLQQSKIPRTVINPPLQDHSAAVAETASLDSIKFLVGCLWRIPIRRPAPVDRVRKQATADMSGYLAFDLMHVRAKFPMVDETVAARLAKMISRRRQLLKYRNDHTNLLQDEATADDVQKVARDNKSGPIEYGKTSEATPSVKTHSHHTDITKATTFRPTEPKPLPLPVPGLYAPSIQSMSSVASEQTENDIPVRVPDRPRGKDGRYLDQFICPYCFTGQAITSERRWRKHVLFDLQPYTCTYSDCQLHEYFFESLNDWYNHESNTHRVEWFCNTASHEPINEMKDFLEHMHVDHSERINETQLLSLRGAFQRPSKAQHGSCTLCGKHASILKSHLAKHLEQLALFAIPQTHYMSDEVQGGSDTNVARQSVVELKRSNSSTVSARSSLNSRRSFDSREAFFLQRDPSIDEDFQQQEIVPDIRGHLEGEVDTSWDQITSKFQDARENTPIVQAGRRNSPRLQDMKLERFISENSHGGGEIVSKRSGELLRNTNTTLRGDEPPPPPKIMFIPPGPEDSLESEDLLQPQHESRTTGVSLTLPTFLRRLRGNSRSPTAISDSPMGQNVPPESTEVDGEEQTTLHPFWRPRGFWDGFEDSDSEDSDNGDVRLPAGGDTSLDYDVDSNHDDGSSHQQLEPKTSGWRHRWRSLSKGKLDESNDKAKSYMGRKEGKRSAGSADRKQTRKEEPGVQIGSYRVIPINPIKWFRDARAERRRESIRKEIGSRYYLEPSGDT